MSNSTDTQIPAVAPRGLAPVRRVLANGATIMAKESRATPAVTIHASLRAGTVYDPPASPGLSHFVSRTVDRGTASRSADDIAELLDSRGVSLSVLVNRHAMSLVCTCLVDDYQAIMSLLAEILRRPTFPETEVETRRGEIITLIRQDEDNPATVAAEGLMALLYGPDHPYGRSTRGTIESVQRIDAAALRAFHASRFQPRFLSLVIVGDLECAHALDVAAETLDGWKGDDAAAFALAPGASAPEGAPPRESFDWLAVPLTPAVRRIRIVPMMNKSQTDIAYGFTSITRSDPAFFAYTLMNNILGQYSLGGRLGDSIRERQGMAYYVSSGMDASVIPGPLMVRAGVSPENVNRAVASIDEELQRMAVEGPTEEELAESRQYLIGSMPRNLETNLGIANYLQMMEFFGLGLDYDLRVPGLLRAVTLDQVRAAARQALDPSRASIVVAGPFDGTLP
jgi:zinc protease